jgi:hypothetical protein
MEPEYRAFFYINVTMTKGLVLHNGAQDIGPCSIQMEEEYRILFYTN